MAGVGTGNGADAAIEHARRLAQRDISADVLVRSYRLGHQAALKAVLEEIRTADLDPRLALDVFDAMSTISFNYIDRISQEVVEVYQQARESWLENRNARVVAVASGSQRRDRLDVEVAPLLCSLFGDRLLDPAGDGG